MPGAATHASVPDARNADVMIYLNGELVPRAEAKISVFDSGFLVGDGIWEGIRLHHGHLVFLEEHLDRLYQGLTAAGIELDVTRSELIEAIEETIARNGMESDVHVRLMITRGTKSTPSQHPGNLIGGPNIVIIAEHKVADPLIANQGISLFTSTVRRPPPDTLDQRLNSHSKLHEVIALVQATAAGADEALMLDTTGAVATCNATNFFVVRKREVWTSTGNHSLKGVTRAKVIELCRAHGIAVHERPFSLTEVYDAHEAFVTGTFGGLTPVHTIDGRAIGGKGSAIPGPVTRRLSGLYHDAIERYSAEG